MREIYIALDHCNLDWTNQKVNLVEEMWNNGDSIILIAKKVKRPVKEVFILIYDRLELGFIKPRKGSILGG